MTKSQRIYCNQDHPGGDQEAENWCRMYHDVQLPRTLAEPTGDFTRMTTCANCGETVERQYTQRQKLLQAAHSPRTRAAAEALGVAEPVGRWVHLQTGESLCG